jgi:hypothetical protein
MSFLKSHIYIVLPLLWMSFSTPPAVTSSPILTNWPYDSKLVQMFPNPASTVINFTCQGPTNQQHILQIYSFIGKKMTEVRIFGNTRLTVQLGENYYRGIYIYQLRDLDGRMIESGKFQVIK